MLRAAIDLFNRKGYDATSIGDVAEELGVTKSAVYHHVPSKEHLLSEALDEALDELEAAVSRAAAADGSAYERLRAVVRRSVEVLVDHQPAVTLLLRVHGNSEIEKAALKRRRRIDARLADLVGRAADEGCAARRPRPRPGQPAAVRDGELARRVVPARPVPSTSSSWPTR